MPTPRVSGGGGFPAIWYVFKKGREAGGVWKLYQRLRSKNACKTCALGMGGQHGGMVNEAGHFPEVCKKSVQAQAGDMAGSIGEDFLARTPIAALETLTSAELERLGRLAFPVIAEPGDTHFRPLAWDAALDRAGAALAAAPPDEVFFYSSGRSSNEAAFLLQLIARAYGTANIHNCSFYCHQASGVALNQVYGSGTASIVLEDLERADFALVAGANPASNHPRLITQLVNLRRRGGKVLVINPLKELGLVRFRVPSDARSMMFGSDVSDLYLQPHVGGDIALLKALLKGVVERGAVDADFVARATDGWDAVRRDVEAASWDELLAACGVPRSEVDAAVSLLVQAQRGVFLWAMGLTHHVHGVDNILALSNLALARGFLGRPGCGLLPIRGHSNVQGVGSMGVSPALKKGFAARLEELYGIRIPEDPGQDTYASMAAAHAGRVRAAVLLGGNLFSSNPDRTWSAAALRNVPLTVAITTKLNEGHVHGRGHTMILLPALARDEEAQATTQESMFNFVRLSEGGKPAVEGTMRSEVDILAALAERILPAGRFDWSRLRSHEALRQEIAKAVPGFAPLSAIGKSKEEFQVVGRTLHDTGFQGSGGKAHFAVTPVPPDIIGTMGPAGPGKGTDGLGIATMGPGIGTVGPGIATLGPGGPRFFRLMTLRSEGQFNTVVYDEEDLYRGNRRRDVVMMARADGESLGLAEGARVRVETEAGALEVSTAFTAIRAGNLAMYYPEANTLVPRRLDPRSKTPAFKSVAARVVPL